MKCLLFIFCICFIALAVIVALLISVVSSVTGAFIEDDRYFEFDEYHHHPDNEI